LNTAIADAQRKFSTAWPTVTSLAQKFAAGIAGNLTANEQMADDLLQRYFSLSITQTGNTNLQTVFTVLNNMNAAIGLLSPSQVLCVSQDFEECVLNPILGQVEAFARCSSWPVYICANAFSQGLTPRPIPSNVTLPTDRDSRSKTMLHELAHVSGACGTPEQYSPDCGTLTLGAAAAARNAENYACLIRGLAGNLSAAAATEAASRAVSELLRPPP